MSTLRDRLIEALGSCPCCGASSRETNTPEDGIPDDYVHETVFGCGSAVFVRTDDQLAVGRSCPWALDLKLIEIMEHVAEGADEDEDDAP